MGSTSVTALAGVSSPPVVIANGQATCFVCNVEDRATAASGFPGGMAKGETVLSPPWE